MYNDKTFCQLQKGKMGPFCYVSQTTKSRATQLVFSLKFKLSHAIAFRNIFASTNKYSLRKLASFFNSQVRRVGARSFPPTCQAVSQLCVQIMGLIYVFNRCISSINI